mmetsp:Transcript_24115/g.47899  ORF Transcript_24115/g.47899 Transcript_24115/m.47899 type:complete len:234 (-) Transcript_24115:302-1003(-)
MPRLLPRPRHAMLEFVVLQHIGHALQQHRRFSEGAEECVLLCAELAFLLRVLAVGLVFVLLGDEIVQLELQAVLAPRTEIELEGAPRGPIAGPHGREAPEIQLVLDVPHGGFDVHLLELVPVAELEHRGVGARGEWGGTAGGDAHGDGPLDDPPQKVVTQKCQGLRGLPVGWGQDTLGIEASPVQKDHVFPMQRLPTSDGECVALLHVGVPFSQLFRVGPRQKRPPLAQLGER